MNCLIFLQKETYMMPELVYIKADVSTVEKLLKKLNLSNYKKVGLVDTTDNTDKLFNLAKQDYNVRELVLKLQKAKVLTWT